MATLATRMECMLYKPPASDPDNQLLSCYAQVALPSTPEDVLNFPVAEEPAAFHATMSLAASIETVTQVPIFPVFAHWLQLKAYPQLRWAMSYRDQILKELVADAVKKFQSQALPVGKIASVLELMVQRESIASEKGARDARFDGPEIRDELLSLLVGGWGRTSTTLCWGSNLLTRHQDVQSKLRLSLTSALEPAHPAQKDRLLKELLKTEPPYLDAVIEEIHRCTDTVPAISRNAVKDAQILGFAIPKGAEVFFVGSDAGLQAQASALNG